MGCETRWREDPDQSGWRVATIGGVFQVVDGRAELLEGKEFEGFQMSVVAP